MINFKDLEDLHNETDFNNRNDDKINKMQQINVNNHNKYIKTNNNKIEP